MPCKRNDVPIVSPINQSKAKLFGLLLSGWLLPFFLPSACLLQRQVFVQSVLNRCPSISIRGGRPVRTRTKSKLSKMDLPHLGLVPLPLLLTSFPTPINRLCRRLLLVATIIFHPIHPRYKAFHKRVIRAGMLQVLKHTFIPEKVDYRVINISFITLALRDDRLG